MDKRNGTTVGGRSDSTNQTPGGHAPSAGQRGRKAPRIITETYLQNAGLHYLQRYAASVERFRAVMQRKIDRSCRHHADQDPEMCAGLLEQLIARYVASGLLNDDGYARGAVASLRRRGLSQRAIMAKLRGGGLSKAQISDALESYNADNETGYDALELQGALKLARRRNFGPYARGAPYDRDKAMAAMARAGFSFDICRKVLDLDDDDICALGLFP